MVSPGFSEFSFGYAFLCEQTRINWGNLKAAPILPSLKQEEELGWDAYLPTYGTDFYYQFKLSEYLYSPRAKYIKDGTYDGAYFKFHFHKRNTHEQHRRLKSFSESRPDTFYVAPEFSGIDRYNTAFLEGRLNQDSRLIYVSQCDDIIDEKYHCITFQQGDANWIQHSAPKVHEHSYIGADIEKVYRLSEDRWRPVDEKFASEVFNTISTTVRESLGALYERSDPSLLRLLEQDERINDRDALLLRASNVLSAFFGANLVIVGQDI